MCGSHEGIACSLKHEAEQEQNSAVSVLAQTRNLHIYCMYGILISCVQLHISKKTEIYIYKHIYNPENEAKMYDTVKLTCDIQDDVNVERLGEPNRWKLEHEAVREKWMLKRGRDADYLPHIEYMRKASDPRTGRLNVEFSLPKWAGIDLLDNMTTSLAREVCKEVSHYISDILDTSIDVLNFKVNRIDYAWNFDMASDLHVVKYIKLFKQLRISRMSTTHYGMNGVTWLNRSRFRAVKFYNKSREQKRLDRHVLRFEVSNYSPAIRYMSDKWFDGNDDLDTYLKYRIALYLLLHVWIDKLGINDELFIGKDDLYNEMYDQFGRSAGTAHRVHTLYHEYGTEAYKSGLVPKVTYYKWTRLLKLSGLLERSTVSMSPISIPTDFHLSQNLGIPFDARAEDVLKILQENLGIE